jgi:hypothetical protein
MMRLLAPIVIALLVAGCNGEDRDSEQPDTDLAMETLISFARAPSDTTWGSVPFSESVGLGLGETLRERHAPRDLRDPSAWQLGVDLFRGRAGTASALDLIASEQGALRVTKGPHPHCAAPPVPPPPQVADLRRVVVQPRDPDGCLDWWTVDAFVNDNGEIEAVTIDLWEP